MTDAPSFTPNPVGTNELLQGDGFYLSFNAAPCAELGFFQGDGGSAETALAIENGKPDGGTAWLILNGDYRAEYLQAFPRGVEACVAVYEAHRATRRSSWSNDFGDDGREVLDWLARRADSVRTFGEQRPSDGGKPA